MNEFDALDEIAQQNQRPHEPVSAKQFMARRNYARMINDHRLKASLFADHRVKVSRSVPSLPKLKCLEEPA